MPEVSLCKYCKQPLNKEADPYVITEKRTNRYPRRWLTLRVSRKSRLHMDSKNGCVVFDGRAADSLGALATEQLRKN